MLRERGGAGRRMGGWEAELSGGPVLAAAGVAQGRAQRHMRACGGDTWGGAAPELSDAAAFARVLQQAVRTTRGPDSDCMLWTPEAHRQRQTRHTVTTHGASAVTWYSGSLTLEKQSGSKPQLTLTVEGWGENLGTLQSCHHHATLS